MNYVNQGLGSCIIHPEGRDYVLKISKHALESDETIAINQRLAEIDPLGERFGYSKHLETLSLSNLSAQWPEIYRAYTLCESSADHSQQFFGKNAGSPSKQVSVSEMKLLYPRPAKALENYQKTFLLDSLKKLHAAGIVHDDIHENNIMSLQSATSALWWPILVDWDQARFTTSATDFANDTEKLEETILKINNDNRRANARRPPRPRFRSPTSVSSRQSRHSRQSSGSRPRRSPGSPGSQGPPKRIRTMEF